MASMFYKVVEDTGHPTSWWLDEIECRGKDIDGRVFTMGRRVENPGTLYVRVRNAGEPMSFTFSLLFVPVVTSQVADLIDRMAPGAVERFPIDVGGIKERYEVLNVVRMIDAIDRERSEYILWGPEDGRPDLVGQFRQVLPLVIRDDIRQDAAIFRPVGWEVVLVVSARLKKELEKIGKLGVLFRPLEGGFTAN